MIEDTIQAVKAAEEEAKKKVSDAREKAHEIARAGDAEIQDLIEAAKAGDKSFYDNEMQLAAQKGGGCGRGHRGGAGTKQVMRWLL